LVIFSPLDEVFFPSLFRNTFYAGSVTVETFKPEIAEAMKAYEKHVICLDKTPDDFQASLVSLLNKAIKAYESRGPQLRHGIALDRQVTVILSQNDSPRPLCGIYFNLHSPYQKQSVHKAGKPIEEPIGESSEE
jgi:hypothetical protein